MVSQENTQELPFQLAQMAQDIEIRQPGKMNSQRLQETHYTSVPGSILPLTQQWPPNKVRGSGFRPRKKYLRCTVYSLYKVMT